MGVTRDVVSFAFLFDETPLLHVGDYSEMLCFLKHFSIHFIRFAHSVAATPHMALRGIFSFFYRIAAQNR